MTTIDLPPWFREDRWVPPPGTAEQRRISRFVTTHGTGDLRSTLDRAARDPEWFYPAAFADLDLPWPGEFDRVRDGSDGIPWTHWFVGGRTNLSWLCIDRWREQGRGGDLALLWEGEDGAVRAFTFDDLGDQVERAAGGLVELGVRQGDVIALYLPMVPEAAVVFHAAARIGAIVAPAFSGYGTDALTERLELSDARVLVTADGTLRRGAAVPMLDTARQAVAACDHSPHVIVVDRLRTGEALRGGETAWDDLLLQGDASPLELFDAETPCLLAFTSGSTGRPKGAVHTHGAMPYRLGIELAYCFDLHAGERLTWVTDMGWIMGPFLVTGPLVLGAASVLLEGVPDHPRPDRLWQAVDDHGVTHLGLSPTLVRAQAADPENGVEDHGLAALRVIASTGEPMTSPVWRWVHRNVGRGHRPLINYSGGTEVGCALLTGYPSVEMQECRFAGPTPGLAVAVFDGDGNRVTDQVGELVVTEPWPSMTRGFWNEPQRFLDTYWSRWPDVWVHGDRAIEYADGSWELPGRSDDLLKVAGKRIGPVEYEALATEVDGVAAAAAVGVPDPTKGQAAVVLIELVPAHAGEPDAVVDAVMAHLEAGLGKAMRPAAVLVVDELPLTRSTKVHRRAARAWLTGADPGDLSTLDNPASEDAVRRAGAALGVTKGSET